MSFLFKSVLEKQIPDYIINLYRFLFCSSIAWEILRDKSFIIQKIQQSDRFAVNFFFQYVDLSQYGPEYFRVLLYALIISLIASALGILTRLSLILSFILFFICFGEFISHRFGMHKDYLPWNQAIVFFNLLILSVSPKINRYGGDNFFKKLRSKDREIFETKGTVYWPVFLLQFHIVISYFAGGIVKLKNTYFWGNGYTLQKHLLGIYMMLDLKAAKDLVQNFYALVFLGTGTLVLELLFPLALWSKRFAFFAVTSTLLAQFYFYAFIELRWMHYYGWSYWIYFILFFHYLAFPKEKQLEYTYSV